jgi:hypothetical protein
VKAYNVNSIKIILDQQILNLKRLQPANVGYGAGANVLCQGHPFTLYCIIKMKFVVPLINC